MMKGSHGVRPFFLEADVAFEFDWVDAFSDRAFGGNGCAVVHGGAVLDDETCMAFTRETGLVECTFTGPSESADFRVKYYLASGEIPFAGHPTLATVAALLHRGMAQPGALTLETGAGVVPVDIAGDVITMRQIAPQFGKEVPPDIVAAVGGLSPQDLVAPPQIVSTGLPFCITLLKDREAVERVTLNRAALSAYHAHLGVQRGDVMEPFWCTLEGATGAGDTFARLLLAPPSPAEDPFTGSATGAMASYLWARGLLKTPTFVAQQGHGMGRPGQAQVEVLGPREAISGVKVGGRGCVLMSGQLRL